MTMKRFGLLYHWLSRLALIVAVSYACIFMCFAIGWPGAVFGVILGWIAGGWLGALLGLFAGTVAWTVVWAIGHYAVARARIRRRVERASRLSTEQLGRVAEDPTSPDLGFALSELGRRGIEARPSLESVLALLTSSQSNRRGLGLSLLHGLYPSVAAKLPRGSANADGPDVWRERLAGLSEASEPDAAPERGGT
jgi:hypothetical protein